MFHDRLLVLAETKERCGIFTPFGRATGIVTFCDQEELHFKTDQGRTYRLYCVDVLALEEFSTVPSE